MSPANPSHTPTISTPALASPAEIPPSENEKAVKPCARVLARLCRSMASSIRAWVRPSIA